MVVCIHATIPGRLGLVTTPQLKIAVPLFFMITGYYYKQTKDQQREKKQLVKILRLLISSFLLFFLWELFMTCVTSGSVAAYFGHIFNLRSILKLVLINDPPLGGHLWYLFALLYVLIIVFLFEKKWSREKLYPFIPVFLLLDLVFGKYSRLLLGLSLPQILVRNFFCVGLPFFLLGDLIKTRNIHMKPKKALLLALVFAFTTVVERFLIGYFHVNAARDHYISTIFSAICIFLLAVQFDSNPGGKLCSSLAYIGANLSSAIYVLHPIFITILSYIAGYCSRYIPGLFSAYQYIAPLVVMLVTTVATWIYHLMVKKAKKKLKTKQ